MSRATETDKARMHALFSNLDKTRTRIVRKGCTVRMGSYRGYVLRVRTGNAIVDWAGGGKGDCKACALLEVVTL